ncbi:MAG: hypothetical protein Kow0069_03470 [Promethearchaeota archaeon]
MLWIFDLDGTITDHPSNFAESVALALKERGVQFDEDLPGRLVRVVQARAAGREGSWGYFTAFNHGCKHVLGIRGLLRRLKFIRRFAKIYHDRLHLAEFYPGVVDALRHLKERGHHVAILTAGSRREVESTLSRNREVLEHLVDAIITREDVPALKPSPVGIFALMERFGVTDRESVAMVGDSWHDVRAARNAGVRSVAVLCGYGTREALAAEGPQFVVNSVSDVPSLLPLLEARMDEKGGDAA